MTLFPMNLCPCTVISLHCYRSDRCYSLRCPEDVIIIDVRLQSYNKPRITGTIFIKFRMEVIALMLPV
jgi:hypothetical protein